MQLGAGTWPARETALAPVGSVAMLASGPDRFFLQLMI